MPKSLRVRAALCAVLVGTALTLAACSTSSVTPTRLAPTPAESSSGLTDIEYSTVGSTHLYLDACLPTAKAADASATPSPSASATKSPVMIVLHGGGFSEGSRTSSGTKTLCTLLADNGVAAFAIDYRLAPQSTYPAQVQDVQHAIEWLRKPAQTARFGIDPTRIGLFGSSAGAIIAQTVATVGTGSLDSGSRVKAVISLSGVSDMSASAAKLGSPSVEVQKLVLSYLGCTSVTDAACPNGARASAIRTVDSTDPPMLLVNGSTEIVPKQQAEAMRTALNAAHVPNTLIIVPGSGHGLSLLNSDVRTAIKKFLADRL